MKQLIIALVSLFAVHTATAQTDSTDLLKSIGEPAPAPGMKAGIEKVVAAFKSSRVINGQSIEMIGKGVLDVRILHRFGYVNEGFDNFFGLDEASMRMGFDYGISRNLSIGIGRSTAKKELDGFVKWRLLQQTTGLRNIPVSVIWVSGITAFGTKWTDTSRKNYFSSRMGYFHQLVIGRKFSDKFSLQLAPMLVHRNLVTDADQPNDTWALGIGGRLKVSKRVALVLDYHPILSGKEPGTYDPLSIGFDIETGGHVFQLHFSNATGMNEKEFITNTTGDFWKGEIRFGFNLSRVFSLRK